VNATNHVGLCFPLAFNLFNGVSFESVVDGGNVFSSEPRLQAPDGRYARLVVGVGVTDDFQSIVSTFRNQFDVVCG